MDDEPTAGHAGADPAGDAVQAGLEQLQRAALDAVRAARAMLEAAESVLQEPDAARVIADTVTTFTRSATETVAGFAAGARPPGPPRSETGDPSGSDHDGDDDGPDGGFERIPVD